MLRKFLRFAMWGLVALVVLVVVSYIEEDWRGAHDWSAYQEELEAKGEILDLRLLVPPGKPEDDLSKVPIFAEAYNEPRQSLDDIMRQVQRVLNNEKNTRKLTRLEEVDINLHDDSSLPSPKQSSYLAGEPFDLVSWQKYYRRIPEGHLTTQVNTPAKDVLQVLGRFDPQINEIQEAFGNSEAYFPINYATPTEVSPTPVTGLLGVAKVVALRGIAHLDDHQIDQAEKDYLFSVRIKGALAKNCLVLNYLIIAGVQAIDNGILWEGIHQHAWSDVQLREMESALAGSDLLEVAAKAWRTERDLYLQEIKLTQTGDTEIRRSLKRTIGDGFWYLLQSRPGGWWDQDRLHCSFMMQRQIDAIALSSGTLHKIEDTRPSSGIRMAYIPFAESLRSTALRSGNVIARAESYQRFARLACRLEEFRIAHAHYPEALGELPDLPAHLNQEVLSDQPLRYKRKGDGYSLYSIGWNGKDDGGMVSQDPREGDWAWPSP